MQKPQGYDEATEFSQGTGTLPAGAYVCKVLKAEETVSSKGKPMLKLFLDIADGDYKGFFLKKYEERKKYNPESSYPCAYIQLTDNAKSLGFLKKLISSFEKSNKNYIFDWNNKNNVSTLNKKFIGFIFAESEFLGTGDKIYTTCKPVSPLSLEEIEEGRYTIPEKKTVERKEKPIEETLEDVGFDESNTNNNADDELPF